MPKKMFDRKLLEAAANYDVDEDSIVKLHRCGEWVADSKYQTKELIFVDRSTDPAKFYRYAISRTGSPFAEWSYSWEWADDQIELTQVIEKEVFTTVWEAIK